MKKIITAGVAGTLIAAGMAAQAGPADSQLEFSSNVALTSDYLFRGISQTDNGPAIQGGFDLSYGLFYAGVWGSNVDFDDSLELDLYLGFAGTTGGGTTWDVGAVLYEYPGDGADGAPDSDYQEYYVSLGQDFGVLSASVSAFYSPDFFAESDDALYLAADVEVPLSEYLALTLHFGDQSIDDNDAFGTPDYQDWSIGLATEMQGFGLSVAWSDTDLDKGDCFGGANICDSTVVVTLSRDM